jgi:IS30 family transposase
MPKLFVVGTRERFVELVISGAGLFAAAAQLGASQASGKLWWAESGGGLEIRRGRAVGLADPVPDRSWGRQIGTGRCLSFAERKVIQTGLRQKQSYRQIGRLIDRSASTVSREVTGHRSADGVYYASVAHARAH